MNSLEVNREGKKWVIDELLSRGAATVTACGVSKRLLCASNSNNSRVVELRVKTKRKGNWHTTCNEGKSVELQPDPEKVNNYWVFVDMAGIPRFWIVPEWWIRNNIHQVHEEYLKKNGGHRPNNDNSNHHSIDEGRLVKWQNKWEVLGIF